MMILEKIQKMTAEELANFLDSWSDCDNPADAWFSDKYCDNCPIIKQDNLVYSYCEINHHCYFFKDTPMLNGKKITQLWLENKEEE